MLARAELEYLSTQTAARGAYFDSQLVRVV